MSITSAPFFIFLAAVCALYYSVPVRFKRYALLAANLIFYLILGLRFTAVILCVLFASFAFGILLERATRKKLMLGLSVSSLIGTLLFFKYTGFLLSLAGVESALKIAAPVGISFYTLTCVGYLVDIYRGDIPAERNAVNYLLFAGLYLQIMSGPIPRAKELLPQFLSPKPFSFERIRSGFLRILFGLFVKTVVADNFATSVNYFYGNYSAQHGPRLVLSTIFYGFQIYCDFRAYSDIAIGSAELLGITLPENFKAPYLSRTVREFWRRWHMSLSGWFRDYLYFPLGGSRKGELLACVNTVIVFAASGLWHGAAMNYLAWGALHGVYLVVSRLLDKPRRTVASRLGIRENGPLRRIVNPIIVFVLVDIAWVLFRAPSLSAAMDIFYLTVTYPDELPSYILSTMRIDHIAATFVGLLVVFVVDVLTNRLGDLRERYFKLPMAVRYIGYYALALSIMLFGQFTVASGFIYYAF